MPQANNLSSAPACALPTANPTAEPTGRAVLTGAAAAPVASCLPTMDSRSPSYEVSRVRRLGELYTACIRDEMELEGSAAHAAARAVSDRAYSVLVEIGDEVMTGGVRSFVDAARLAARVNIIPT